jgi:hypothetical protein
LFYRRTVALVAMLVAVLAGTAIAASQTNVDNLDDLANAIANSSPKIKAYAQAQAAATQSQELAIRDLEARVAALENPTPPPPPPPPPPPGPAQFYIAPNGNDANSCLSATAPCQTMQRAYSVANLGDTVEIAGGTYPAQLVQETPDKAAVGDLANVVFRPAAEATVTITDLRFGLGPDGPGTDGPDHITLQDVRAPAQTGWAIHNDSNDITLLRIDVGSVFIGTHSAEPVAVNSVQLLDSDLGPCTTPADCSNTKVQNANNVTMRGNLFHDIRIQPGSGEHLECVFWVSGLNTMITQNRFEDCSFYDIFVQRFDGLDSTGEISYNWLETAWCDDASCTGQNRDGSLAFSPQGRPFHDILVKCNHFVPPGGLSLNDDGDGTVYGPNFVVIPEGDPRC